MAVPRTVRGSRRERLATLSKRKKTTAATKSATPTAKSAKPASTAIAKSTVN